LHVGASRPGPASAARRSNQMNSFAVIAIIVVVVFRPAFV
jgi:hypothetical protein